jgi:hypothetical protein
VVCLIDIQNRVAENFLQCVMGKLLFFCARSKPAGKSVLPMHEKFVSVDMVWLAAMTRK